MKLREQILYDHTKPNAELIANWIGKDEKKFKELMQLFLFDDHRVVQRSAWVLSMCADKYPELIEPYLAQMLEQCTKQGVHVAVKRNVTRILQNIPIPAAYEETIMNLCFELLLDQKETIAVRCFSMTILEQLCATYPEIKNELKHIIEDALEHQEVSAAFKNRSEKILKRMSR